MTPAAASVASRSIAQVPDVIEAKRELRRAMRAMRRALPDQEALSAQIWANVVALPEVVAARTVMVFDSVPGEPITGPFIEWCREQGKVVALPEDAPAIDPALVDVVIVPGLAFTDSGGRLGQGGGWYDRFLAHTRADCVTVGVGFRQQLVAAIPTEPHDVDVSIVVSDAGAVRCAAP